MVAKYKSSFYGKHPYPLIDHPIHAVKCVLILAMAFMGFFANAYATHTWNGGPGDNWNNPTNWLPQSVPTNNDDVIIPSSVNYTIHVDQANASCASLTYTGTGFELHLVNSWKLIISGNVNLSGQSSITGGTLEFIGNNPIQLHYSDSVTIDVAGIDVKSNSSVTLHNDLFIPYSYLKIHSGNFVVNGNTLTAKEIMLVGGSQPRTLDISQSTVNVSRMFLNTVNNGAFISLLSSINVSLSINLTGNASFNEVNTVNGVILLLEGTGYSGSIKNLNASGDIALLGSKTYSSQTWNVQNLNILASPAVAQFTTAPYMSAYNVSNISIPPACQGQVVFTDGAETNAHQVPLNLVFADQLDGAAFANISVNPGGLTVTNGTQLGNSSGILFYLTSPATYYWVNGQGEWNDGLHWSLTSGGAVSGCIPKMHDAVIFDHQSGLSVTDTVFIHKHAFCSDFTASPSIVSKPRLVSKLNNGQTMNISGSLDFSGFQELRFDHPVNFWGSGFHTIRMNGNQFLSGINFFTNGEWTLLDALTCRNGTRILRQYNGTLITNNQDVTVGGIISNSIKLPYSQRGMELGSSKMVIGHPSQNCGSVTINSHNLALDAGTSEFHFVYLAEETPIFQILANEHLVFHNLYFKTKISTPILAFNNLSYFNKIRFEGNGLITGTPSFIQPDLCGADTLMVTAGFRYEFLANGYFTIGKRFMTDTNACNNVALLTSTDFQYKSKFHQTVASITMHHVKLENLEATGSPGIIHVQNGFDGGNNIGFNFHNQVSGNIFYWNGEGSNSNWSNDRNWNMGLIPVAGNNNDLPSLANPNGCIPNFIDSVVFHPNSFPLSDTVIINENINYTGMNWMPGTGTGKILKGSSIYINNNYGGLRLDLGLSLSFAGSTYFRNHLTRTIETQNVTIPGPVIFKCYGEYRLLDQFTCTGNKLEVLSGKFIANGNTVNAKNFLINHNAAPANVSNTIDLDNSVVNISSNFISTLHQNKSVFTASGTEFRFTGASASMQFSGTLNNIFVERVRFQNQQQGSLWSVYNQHPVSFHYVQFDANGLITGNNVFDTLIFAEGREYQLGSTFHQNINEALISRGSPCYRTTITSTIPGVRAFVHHPSCNIIAEHARIRDLEGVVNGCSASNYIVNVGGEDLGNNANWTFIPGNPINGLGNDTVAACSSFPFTISAAGFGSYSSILWSDGSTGQQCVLNGPDTISAVVIYSPVCQVEDVRVVNIQNSLVANADIVHEPCYGDSVGSIIAGVTGGNGNYAYQWITPVANLVNDSTASNLITGVYHFQVVQIGYESYCNAGQNVTVSEPGQLIATVAPHHVTCAGLNDGQVEVTVQGGTAGFDFAWDHDSQAGTSQVSGLAPGTYTANVTDANGCSTQTSITIADALPLTYVLHLTDVECGLNNGKAILEISGGSGPYYFVWNNDPGNYSAEAINLRAGNYSVTVTDSNNCSLDIEFELDLLNVPSSSISVTDADCFGSTTGSAEVELTGGIAPYQFGISPGSAAFIVNNVIQGLAAGTYVIQSIDAHGCIVNDTVVIGQPEEMIVNAFAVQHPSCYGASDGIAASTVIGGVAPYTYHWMHDGSQSSGVAGLVEGDYLLTVTDATQCSVSDTLLISQPGKLNVLATITREVLCYGESSAIVIIETEGGTPGFQYWFNGVEGTSSMHLPAGDYEVLVEDVNGCTESTSFQLGQPEPIVIELVEIIAGKCASPEGIAEMNVSGGSGSYTYSWSNGESNEDLAAAYPGVQALTVTDLNGCSSSFDVTIPCIDQLDIPELVTPNGDGYNDNWEIHELQRLYPSNKVKIMNRWGNLVYEEGPYSNSFNGMANTGTGLGSGLLPSGTYFFIIELGSGYTDYTGFIELQY